MHQLYQEESEAREVWNVEELRKHAKEITKQCEEKGYTIEEAEMLVHVLQNEIDQCKKIILQKNFKALAE